MMLTQEEIATIRHEAAQSMKANCVAFLEGFAQQYVAKWEDKTGDSAKAEGWVILQAAVALRDSPI